jgi:Asp-tRNA(Asn)/Glu-tRNA(Gln) amidotransferase A subunit family amidase
MKQPRTSSVAHLGAQLRAGRTTIAAVIEAARARIERLNPHFRAFSHIATPDGAVIAKLQAELHSREARSPLHGVPVSVKGNIPVAGLRWTEGSRIFARRVAARDAAIVAKLRAAGGVVLGTTTLSELAMYGVTNEFEPMGLNPWDTVRTAGGSSTGAGVAAALEMAAVNICTDSGGSIRNPACHCGVVGFMPRIGALTTTGKPNYAPSLSSVGLIGGSVADVAEAYQVLAEPVPEVAAPPTFRLLVPRRLVETMCDDETRILFAAALARLEQAGCTILERDLAGWAAGEAAAGTVSLYECGRALACMDLSAASEGMRRRAEAALRVSPDQVAVARTDAARFRGEVEAALAQAGADAFVSPTWPFAAPAIAAERLLVNGQSVSIDPHRNCFVRAANAIDACAMTLPMGLYPSAAVPAGLHLMAPGGWEGRLLSLAGRAEAALPALPPALG